MLQPMDNILFSLNSCVVNYVKQKMKSVEEE